MSKFAKLQYKLNNRMLYFMDNENDIRSVLYGLNLIDVITKYDDITSLSCCARIEPSIKFVEIPLYQFKGFCFRIELKT